ncbi:MAG: hypothetical protein PHF64_12580, partial [Methanoregula sp.]|nr:hypothetical protein [Methanoregula sp.]
TRRWPEMKAEKKFFAWPIQQKERHAALKAGYRPGDKIQAEMLRVAQTPIIGDLIRWRDGIAYEWDIVEVAP